MDSFLFASGLVQSLQTEQQAYRHALRVIKQIFVNNPETPIESNKSEIFFLLQGVSLEGVLTIMAHLDGPQRQHMVIYLTHVRNFRADINGNDLKAQGHKPGPFFAEVLKEVLKAKLDGNVVHKDAQLALADKLLKEKKSLKQ